MSDYISVQIFFVQLQIPSHLMNRLLFSLLHFDNLPLEVINRILTVMMTAMTRVMRTTMMT